MVMGFLCVWGVLRYFIEKFRGCLTLKGGLGGGRDWRGKNMIALMERMVIPFSLCSF